MKTTEVFDTNTKEWTLSIDLPVELCHHVILSLNSNIQNSQHFLIGGYDHAQPSYKKTWMYDWDVGSWVEKVY